MSDPPALPSLPVRFPDSVRSAHTFLPHSMLATAVLALAPAVPLAPQDTITWSRTTSGPVEATVHALPDGGAFEVLRRGAFTSPGETYVRRRDGNGDEIWEVRAVLPAGLEGLLDPTDAATTPDRGLVIAHDRLLVGRAVLTSFDEQGGLRWQTVLEAGSPGLAFEVEGLSVAPDGDVHLVALAADSLSGAGAQAFALALDGATGIEQWRVTRATDAWATQVTAAFAGSETAMSFLGVPGPRTVRLDGDGVVTLDIAGPASTACEFLSYFPGGDLLMGRRRSQPPRGSELFRVDPQGAVLWARSVPSAGNRHDDLVITADGEIALLDTGSGPAVPPEITRLGPGGLTRWSRSVDPSFLGVFTEFAADVQGGVALTGVLVGPSGPGAHVLERIDADGSTSSLVVLRETGGGALFARAPRFDQLGSAYVMLQSLSGSEVELLEIADGDAGATAVCSAFAPNSTGAFSRLVAAGSAQVTGDNLTLVADRLPAGSTVLMLAARSQGLVPFPGGSMGWLCLGGSIGRFVGPGEVRIASFAGRASLELDLHALPLGTGSAAALAGEAWYFQAWHRDVVAGQATSNLTNALRIEMR